MVRALPMSMTITTTIKNTQSSHKYKQKSMVWIHSINDAYCLYCRQHT